MFRSLVCALLVSLSSIPVFAQELHFTSVPAGYRAGSIALPRGFAGAMAADPTDPHFIYASLGDYGQNDLARINVYTGAVTTVAHNRFASLNGIAPISRTKIVCIDNFGGNAGMPNDTILLLSDNNTDGDFDDAGEISELISPILTSTGGFGFTGAQARIAPANNAANIPAGALVLQTADGGASEAEVLVVKDPLTTPAFLPSGGAFFDGFDFNGGLAFDIAGRLIIGEQTSFIGAIHCAIDSNSDGVIGAGESNILAAAQTSLADVAVDAEDDVFFCAGNGTSLALRTFRLPSDPLTSQPQTPADFAVTDSSYLTAVVVSSLGKPFTPGTGAGGAVLLTGGWTLDFQSARNLLTLTPDGPSAATAWEAYR